MYFLVMKAWEIHYFLGCYGPDFRQPASLLINLSLWIVLFTLCFFFTDLYKGEITSSLESFIIAAYSLHMLSTWTQIPVKNLMITRQFQNIWVLEHCVNAVTCAVNFGILRARRAHFCSSNSREWVHEKSLLWMWKIRMSILYGIFILKKADFKQTTPELWRSLCTVYLLNICWHLVVQCMAFTNWCKNIKLAITSWYI